MEFACLAITDERVSCKECVNSTVPKTKVISAIHLKQRSVRAGRRVQTSRYLGMERFFEHSELIGLALPLRCQRRVNVPIV
jgi:hypothetical protein